jgi:hypothetical protein
MTEHPPPGGPPRPEIAELAWITAELARLDQARRQLLARREFLLAELASPAAPRWAPAGPGPAPVAGAGRRAEMSRHGAAALLLAVGVLLVVIAAGP